MMVKKIPFLSLLLGCFCLGAWLAAPAAAFSPLQGDWYDDKGALVLSIQGDAINGSPIAAIFDQANGPSTGAARFRLETPQGAQELHLSWRIRGDQHDHIIYDGVFLQRSDHDFSESVGGIHLDMPLAAVLAALGTPNQRRQEGTQHILTYADRGMTIYLQHDHVYQIALAADSTVYFDSTLLAANDPPAAYEAAYSFALQEGQFGALPGAGEFFRFAAEPRVVFTIFPSSYD